ncbi:hypothetical protein AGABI1DRAFT_107238 [Agaricus bisporus var. burnettii JB137-S8]|uniref:NAD-dependent epimerase/dehydratase domain-containing protein n=1 Tax=Agaricus bisporus var. burnettii (strain JB137-S8 / ATCC MYA-4627 / FGSC 10392) TaxID=597362 RepID=K5VW94_AGABU|nr:uncharacterized protein AGABI1DRAFT_107238 [Agaricus bisporus var. burnettii JB137-S8]EKM78749.1 hypothetical protein AGABI1DRAFT_107238 [Agaricus bisporus var. burnettii JB137-S8]
MGITTAPSKVLVTGANGYVAMRIVDQLLNAGYSVRGTIRTLDKSKDLRQRFSDFVEAGKLEFAVVEDMGNDGAFDDAVKDVDGVIHTASPVTIIADNPEEVIKPAVSGTLNILESALKFGNKLKRIILTSSTATIFSPVTQPTVLNETHWNTVAVEEVERLGREANSFYKYMTSKVYAEKAFWNFYDAHKTDISWDVSAIIPPYIFGPALNIFKTPSEQNASTKLWWDNVIATPATPESASFAKCWVDVRDLALAHMLALQKPDAGGERLLISAGPFTYQDWIDIASTHRSPLKTHEFPHHKEFGGYLPKGCPDVKRDYLLIYDNAKGLKILGPELKYRTMEETTADILKDYAARGW